ncbi:MAG: substrate-binding domain-containing protein [Acidobacteriota bacterium]|nr:substrate-binding domain-containing protein [Acidobacteriota bacterium]MDW3228661.1 substrate-binding domain-containing protein [Acidobacteriota bacterium]
MVESNDSTKQVSRREKTFFCLLILSLIFLLICGMACSKEEETGEGLAKSSQEKSAIASSGAKDLIVATTTSLQDSGLLDVIIPVFKEESGLKVKVIAVGTGEAIEMGRRQVADLLLVHSPDMEVKFMAEGYGERREELMSSDFVLVGPPSDKAGVRNKTFPEAFSLVAKKQTPFVSRADNSGTHNLEMKIWAEAGIEPSGNWYLQTGQGMGESLQIASEKQAYILSDYPTFHRLRSSLNLEVLTRDERFANVYSAIVVKNKSGRINASGAEALANFLISDKVQKMIVTFGADFEGKAGLFKALRLNGENEEK